MHAKNGDLDGELQHPTTAQRRERKQGQRNWQKIEKARWLAQKKLCHGVKNFPATGDHDANHS
jgi:hypothetical protein